MSDAFAKTVMDVLFAARRADAAACARRDTGAVAR